MILPPGGLAWDTRSPGDPIFHRQRDRKGLDVLLRPPSSIGPGRSRCRCGSMAASLALRLRALGWRCSHCLQIGAQAPQRWDLPGSLYLEEYPVGVTFGSDPRLPPSSPPQPSGEGHRFGRTSAEQPLPNSGRGLLSSVRRLRQHPGHLKLLPAEVADAVVIEAAKGNGIGCGLHLHLHLIKGGAAEHAAADYPHMHDSFAATRRVVFEGFDARLPHLSPHLLAELRVDGITQTLLQGLLRIAAARGKGCSGPL